jgi:hypothetical protein
MPALAKSPATSIIIVRMKKIFLSISLVKYRVPFSILNDLEAGDPFSMGLSIVRSSYGVYGKLPADRDLISIFVVGEPRPDTMVRPCGLKTGQAAKSPENPVNSR